MTSHRWILGKIMKIYKHADQLAAKIGDPEASEIVKLCEQLGKKYSAAVRKEREEKQDE